MKKNKPLAFCFHGFLGQPKDFHILEDTFRVVAPDLKPFSNKDQNFLSWQQLGEKALDEFKNVDKSDEDVIYVFSYSMGSKLLFSVFKKFKNLFPKVKFIFLSTHFGLYESEQELQKEIEWRAQSNARFLLTLEADSTADLATHLNLEVFLSEWDNLSLFNKDVPIETVWSLAEIKYYFKNWSQSQLDEIPVLLDTKDSYSICYGQDDKKYKEQAQRLKKKVDLSVGDENLYQFIELPEASHRIISKHHLKFILKLLR